MESEQMEHEDGMQDEAEHNRETQPAQPDRATKLADNAVGLMEAARADNMTSHELAGVCGLAVRFLVEFEKATQPYPEGHHESLVEKFSDSLHEPQESVRDAV